MDLKFENIKVGEDEEGLYLEIPFTPNKAEKVRPAELFEDYSDDKMRISLQISTEDISVPKKNAPKAFFDYLTEEELSKIREGLFLKSRYVRIRDDLNIHKALLRDLENNPPKYKWNSQDISNLDNHKKWAEKVIQKVKELIHYNMGQTHLEVEEGPQIHFRNIILKKLYIKTTPYLKLPAILAYPENLKKTTPAIVCVHGHNSGKINTIGALKSSSNSYYGIELALRGFVTLSLDQWGWGEREGRTPKIGFNSESKMAMIAQLLGYTAIGIRSWEVSKAIDYLQSLDFVAQRFGVIGQSGGGTTAAFSSVVDPRIYAAVVSGYFCSWKYSIFNVYHCPCNFVPELMRWVEMSDLMAARAPKPLFIVSGEFDPIFPQDGVQDAYNKLKETYSFLDAEEQLGIDVIPNIGHVFRGDYAYPWLENKLKLQK